MTGGFRERGQAKAEARNAAGHERNRARGARKLEAVRVGKWATLSRLLRRSAYGRATAERLLEFCADAPSVEQGERVLLMVATWALDQADPVAALNAQLNEAEKARDAQPKIDPAWSLHATKPQVLTVPIQESEKPC